MANASLYNRGCHGSVECCPRDNLWHGKIQGYSSKDSVLMETKRRTGVHHEQTDFSPLLNSMNINDAHQIHCANHPNPILIVASVSF